MKFYTNVFKRKNYIYVRGYNMGRRFEEKIKYKPYLFVPSKTKNSKYKTIDEKPVEKISFDSMSEARDFFYKYQNVEGFDIYGMDNFLYPFIYDNYPREMDYDPSIVNTTVMDIEVAADDGFPSIELASKEITAITLMNSSATVVFGCGEYKSSLPNVTYIKCADEYDLLQKFLSVWESDAWSPDILTGWNCLPLNTNIWKNNEIITLDKIKNTDILSDTQVVNMSPVTNKKVYQINLANGTKIKSSGDHIFPILHINKEKYTKLEKNNKNESILFKKDFKVVDIPLEDSCFVEMPIHNNTNIDNEFYTNDQLYLAGFVFSDGSLKDKNNPTYGYNIYQKDANFLKTIFPFGNIYGSFDKCYGIYVNKKYLGETHELIYNGNKKELNVNLISKLSKSQFMYFLSGMLDGDGCNLHGSIGICNYDGNLEAIEQLCRWNGIFVTTNKNIINFIDLDINDLHIKKIDRWYNIKNNKIKRNNSQKAKLTRFKKIGNSYFVRISSILETNDYENMMDIETESHYFVANGIRVHNCEFFDIPYIVNRIKRLFNDAEANRLSPLGILDNKKVEINGKENTIYLPAGISVLDYLPLYKKFSFGNQESYKLDFIANAELGEKKIDYSMYGSLLDLYKNNYQVFIDYNIHDCTLVKKLENKLGFIQQVMALSYDARVNYNDTLTTVRPWDVIIHNELLDDNYVIPQMKHKPGTRTIAGGYVKPPQTGMHKYVISLDLDSLYPHLEMQYNISPDTFLGRIHIHSIDEILNGNFNFKIPKNSTITANGCVFTKEKRGFLPKLMDKMYSDRKKFKNKMLEVKKEYEVSKDALLIKEISRLHNMQMAKKIQLNAAYGALANEWFRWFDEDVAESITMSGQLSIRWIEKKLNEYLNNFLKTENIDYVIASDTDSVYLTCEYMVENYIRKEGMTDKEICKILDKFSSEKLAPFIKKSYEELANKMNAYEQKMNMKRECIANKAIWTEAKHYILNVYNQEGVEYDKPKLKIQGIEAVRSSTPMAARKAIIETLDIIMNKDENSTIEYIQEFKKKFKTMPINDVAFPRGVNHLQKYSDKSQIYSKGTPAQVKASLLYNFYIKEKNLLNKYHTIKEKDKIKWTYLTMPNPLKDKVIGWPDEMPKEFGLEKYVDYETQFEKAYMAPVQKILSSIGWKAKKQATLFGLFKK